MASKHEANDSGPDRPGAAASPAGPSRRPARVGLLPALPYLADAAQFGALVHRHLAECRRWSVPLAVMALGVECRHLPQDRRAVVLHAQLLQEAGQRLRGRARHLDSVVRVGRNGFGVVLVDAGDAAARHVELRMAQALQSPFRLGAASLSLAVKVGIAVHPQAGATGEALVLAAERARDRAAG